MKHFTIFSRLPIAAVLIVSLYTCKKDSSLNVSLVGIWVRTSAFEKGQIANQTYIFKTDSTVQITRTIVDSASGNLLGYQYLSTGKFRLNNDQLRLYKLNTRYNSNAFSPYYAPASQLMALTTDTLQSFTIKFDPAYTTCTFIYPPCGPNENCIGQLSYKRQ